MCRLPASTDGLEKLVCPFLDPISIYRELNSGMCLGGSFVLWVVGRLYFNGSFLRLEVVIKEDPSGRDFGLEAWAEPLVGMMVTCSVPGLEGVA